VRKRFTTRNAVEPGTRIVIPSLNGSRLMALADRLGVDAVTGCLRDRTAAAEGLRAARCVGLVAAGERWEDDSVRFALEDWLGVGAIAACLDGPRSPADHSSLHRRSAS